MGFKGDINDIVIIVVGPTGSGKTRFIDTLAGKAEQSNDGGSLKTHTQSVTPYIIPYDGPTQLPGRLVLVDTPGLDEASQPDAKMLREIFDGLKAKYSNGVMLRLTGIIYLHRITDNRMSGSLYKDPQLLGRLCGNMHMPISQVRLVTTTWDKMMDKQAVAEKREKELMDDFWQPLKNQGAATRRFDNTPASAREIITDLLRQNGEAIQKNRPNKAEADDPVPRCFGFC